MNDELKILRQLLRDDAYTYWIDEELALALSLAKLAYYQAASRIALGMKGISDPQSEEHWLLEALAEMEHEQWMQWAVAVAPEVSDDRRQRWQGCMVPYQQLPDGMKEHDRVWARKALMIMKGYGR